MSWSGFTNGVGSLMGGGGVVDSILLNFSRGGTDGESGKIPEIGVNLKFLG